MLELCSCLRNLQGQPPAGAEVKKEKEVISYALHTPTIYLWLDLSNLRIYASLRKVGTLFLLRENTVLAIAQTAMPFLDNRDSASITELREVFSDYDTAGARALAAQVLEFLLEHQPIEHGKLRAWAEVHTKGDQSDEARQDLVFAALCKVARRTRERPEEVAARIRASRSCMGILIQKGAYLP